MNSHAVITGFHIGDMIFQLITLLFILAIPVAIIILFILLRKRNNRLERIEEKLDKILADRNDK